MEVGGIGLARVCCLYYDKENIKNCSKYCHLRPFFTQSDLSVENDLSTEAQIGFSYTVEKWLVRPNFFRPSFPTGSARKKTQSKKFCTCFLNPWHRSSHHKTHTHTPVASLIPPQNTHPHAHTPTPGTREQCHTTAPTLAWLSLLLLLAASQRGALLAPLASSVYHTTAAARGIDAILPTTTRTPAVALASLG